MSITQNGVLKHDDNDYPVMGGTSSSDNATIINSAFDPVTRRLLVDSAGGGGTGTVTSITAGTGLAATPSNPITVSGTIALDSKLAPLDTLGSAGQSIRVNAGATALEYYTPSGTTSPGGLNTQIQYNNAGVFGGITGATTDGTIVSLTNPLIGGATITTSTVNGVTLTTGGSNTTFLDGTGAYSTPAGGGGGNNAFAWFIS